MAAQPSSRLALGSRPAPKARSGFVAVARYALGLSTEEAEALWDRLPTELLLAPMDEVLQQRLHDRLAATGVAVTLAPGPPAERCARHRKLASRDVCPRCEAHAACAACLELGRERACAACAARARRRIRFRRWRIAVLLAILAAVGTTAYVDRRRVIGWRRPLVVAIFPMNGDGSDLAARYLRSLGPADFEDVARFMEREGKRHGIATRPLVQIAVGPEVAGTPPPPPAMEERSAVRIALWSLRLRAWVFRASSGANLPAAQIRIFALYHAPRPGLALEHSLGLEKGHIGVAHLYAGREEAPANGIVIAHELLHTAGATDKYDERGLPVFPDGYADPGLGPAQRQAEIMGGRIPVSAAQARPAESLDACVVGEKTAREIGWRR